jgi:hypothetical protein
LGLGLALAAHAQAPLAATDAGRHDGVRQAWRYRREVRPAARETLVALALPPEVHTRAQPELRDLRLVAPDGSDVPYVLDRLVAQAPVERFPGNLDDVRRETRQFSQWQVDFGATRRFERLELSVPQTGFAKRLRVEGSQDGSVWQLLSADAGIFEREWQGRLRQTAVVFDQPQSARYVRLTADDKRSAVIDVTGVDAVGPGRSAGARWSRPATLTDDGRAAPAGTSAGARRLRVTAAPGLPVEWLTLDATDPVFSRQVRLLEQGADASLQVLGSGRLFRLSVPSEGLASSLLTLPVRPPGPGQLVLEIDDGDSPPLRGLRVTLEGHAERLVFSAPQAETLTLYYGNAATRAPLYDVQALSARLGLVTDLPAALLSDEQANPRYVPAPPLRFLAPAGAPLDVTRWRRQRALVEVEREDLYSVTLDAHDLADLRPDLADLRLADAAGRQVPYVLEREAAEQALPLESEARGDEPRPGLRRYRLYLPTPAAGSAERLPWAALELDFALPFFSRPARLFTEDGEGLRHPGERTLWAGRLERQEGRTEAQVLALTGERWRALTLEVDDGDDQPLVPTRALVRVRVPRLTFKAGPGPLRLLLGCADATPPRYDIDTLRRELLTYSAAPLGLGAALDNADHRRRVGDLLSRAPSTWLLWGTLGAAIVALLLLTARILRQAEAGGPPEPPA